MIIVGFSLFLLFTDFGRWLALKVVTLLLNLIIPLSYFILIYSVLYLKYSLT